MGQLTRTARLAAGRVTLTVHLRLEDVIAFLRSGMVPLGCHAALARALVGLGPLGRVELEREWAEWRAREEQAK